MKPKLTESTTLIIPLINIGLSKPLSPPPPWHPKLCIQFGKGLVTNYGEGGGGLQNGRGGARVVLPLRKDWGGAEKVLAILNGGHKQFWGSFYGVA